MKIDKNELNIYEVASLHQDILDEFKKGDVIIDMSNVKSIDLSIIQLFISAKKSCNDSTTKFMLTNISQELVDIFKSAKCESIIGESYE